MYRPRRSTLPAMLQHPSAVAATAPDRPAVVIAGSGQVLSYEQLDARSNQVANLLRAHGVEVGAHVALLLENRREFLEVFWGALRAGVYTTPINWHLNAAEVGYVVDDCGAALLFGSSELLPLLEDEVALPADRRIAVGGDVPGLADYETLVARYPDTPL